MSSFGVWLDKSICVLKFMELYIKRKKQILLSNCFVFKKSLWLQCMIQREPGGQEAGEEVIAFWKKRNSSSPGKEQQ